MSDVRRTARPIRDLAKATARPLAHRWFGSIEGAHTREPVVALTFDDGPHPRFTPGILDALASHNAKATFFFISHRAATYPELARRVLMEGHEVGLHGLDHLPLPILTLRAVNDRVRKGRKLLEEVIGQRVALFRPPHGDQTIRTYLSVRLAGMQVVGWTATCQDWEQLDLEVIIARAEQRLEPGGILLLHDFVEPDVRRPEPAPTFDRARMVELLLDKLDRKGLEYRTVTDLISGRQERRSLWYRRLVASDRIVDSRG